MVNAPRPGAIQADAISALLEFPLKRAEEAIENSIASDAAWLPAKFAFDANWLAKAIEVSLEKFPVALFDIDISYRGAAAREEVRDRRRIKVANGPDDGNTGCAHLGITQHLSPFPAASVRRSCLKWTCSNPSTCFPSPSVSGTCA